MLLGACRRKATASFIRGISHHFRPIQPDSFQYNDRTGSAEFLSPRIAIHRQNRSLDSYQLDLEAQRSSRPRKKLLRSQQSRVRVQTKLQETISSLQSVQRLHQQNLTKRIYLLRELSNISTKQVDRLRHIVLFPGLESRQQGLEELGDRIDQTSLIQQEKLRDLESLSTGRSGVSSSRRDRGIAILTATKARLESKLAQIDGDLAVEYTARGLAAIPPPAFTEIPEMGGTKRQKLHVDEKVTRLDTCGAGDVLFYEAQHLLSQPRLENGETSELVAETSVGEGTPLVVRKGTQFRQMTVTVEAFSSTGEGLARHPSGKNVLTVPFALKGERVLVKAPEAPKELFCHADLLEVIQPSKLREGITPKCKYFGDCTGCQLQMISYEDQLKHKKTIVENAYREFSGLEPAQIPPIGDTGASPLQYDYRTKLTPHFDGPGKGSSFSSGSVPPIGFNRKGFRKVLDIESCPIATPIIQDGLRKERAKVAVNIKKYKRGATILLRETTERTYSLKKGASEEASASSSSSVSSFLPPHSLDSLPAPDSSEPVIESTDTGPIQTVTYTYPATDPPTVITDTKRYTTDNTADSIEQIGAYTFTSRAGSFFQNNNSILPPFLSYVRDHALPSDQGQHQNGHHHNPRTSPALTPNPTSGDRPIKYLLDAYCGSGLFALTLSPLFTSVLGIELDPHGVTAARRNAQTNQISNAHFIEADAAALFADVPFPCDQTALVIDPPRKGCSVGFLRQLLRYAPRRVIYVSCNVNSQARDVGCLVRGRVGDGWWVGGEDGDQGKKKEYNIEVGKYRYEIEELRGYDFFPQTAHVEGLCILKRVPNEAYVEE